MRRLVTVHGIGVQHIGYAAPLVAACRPESYGNVWWERLQPRWTHWFPVSWIANLLTVFMVRRRAQIVRLILDVVGDGDCTVVAHSHGVWLVMYALGRPDSPVVRHLVTMGRSLSWFRGFWFVRRGTPRARRTTNLYSLLDPLSGSLSSAYPNLGHVTNYEVPVTHTEYWNSPSVASIVSLTDGMSEYETTPHE